MVSQRSAKVVGVNSITSHQDAQHSGESLDAAQKEAKQEMDRIVAQADKQALHRLKSQARLTNTDRSGARRAQQATPSSSLSSTSTSSHDIGKRWLKVTLLSCPLSTASSPFLFLLQDSAAPGRRLCQSCEANALHKSVLVGPQQGVACSRSFC